jgi:hypothetical protein
MGGSRHRVFDRLLLVTNLVVGNAAAACVVVLFVRPGALAGVDHQPLASFGDVRVAFVPLHSPLAYLVLALAIGLLVWNFAWLVRRQPSAPPSNWVISDTPSGPVRIAREAIENGLQKAGEALPEVTRVRVQVDVRQQKRLLVTAQFHCAEGQNNLAASQRLRAAMSDRLREMVRVGDGSRVEIELEFQGFAGKLGKKAAEVPPHAEPPFTGPQYPIDDEPGTP